LLIQGLYKPVINWGAFILPENGWFLLLIRVKVCPIFCGIERSPFEIGIRHVTERTVLLRVNVEERKKGIKSLRQLSKIYASEHVFISSGSAGNTAG
jgi:hypothetical protein